MIRGIVQEGFVFFLFASVILFTSLLSATASAGSERQLSFSNKDLEPYEDAPGSQREFQAPGTGISESRKNKAPDSKEDREKEYWCKRATPQRRKIQQLTEEISIKEHELANENASLGRKKVGTLNKSLTKSRKHLKDAEVKFSDLEDEAYRKGVPIGWLRCQFE